MTDSLKIIQITDPHLRADADAVLHGWHVDTALRRVMDDALYRHPDADCWALTGDLVDDETDAGYSRLDAQLTMNCPVLALAGNHDSPQAMESLLTGAHVHASIRLGGWQLHALNSHVDDSEAGRLGQAQLHKLQRELAADTRPAVLFIHHPPIGIDSDWIDAIGLTDRAAFRELIRSQTHVAAIVCGHAHQAFESTIGRAACWITPSTMRQFKPTAKHFALDLQAQPGYRVVELKAAGSAASHVQRVPCYPK